MADGYLLVVAGQSWVDGVYSGSSRKATGERSDVYQMTAGSRVFSPFNNATNWNAYFNGVVNGNCMQFKFADEWQVRNNIGTLSDPLFLASVARGGAAFDLCYSVAGFNMFRADRAIGDGACGSSGTFQIPSDQGGGVYPIGDTYSASETLAQVCAAGAAQIAAMDLTPRLLGIVWAQGHAEATISGLTQAEYYAYETGLKTSVETALGIEEAPWFTWLISGDGLDRPAAAAVNVAKVQIGEEFPLARALDFTQSGFYDPEDAPSYGGIFGADGDHLSDFGCWLMSEMQYKATIDNGFTGIAL